jgi:hypothetical protein
MAMRALFGTLLLVGLLSVGATAAPARYAPPRNTPLSYEVRITGRFAHAAPWTGILILTITGQGIVSGQYRSTSVKPDPFFGRITNVRGGLSGTSIRIDFNTSGTYQLKGTLEKDKIVGTFYDPRRRMYDFRAVRVPAKA